MSHQRRLILGGGLLLLLLVAVLIGVWILLRDEPTQKIIDMPTRFPTATLTPTHTPNPTTPPRPELLLSSNVPNNQLPGDSHSQALISVELLNLETVETATLEIFFEVQGGGSVSPSRLSLNTSPLQTTYTAGETSNMKDVQITAIVDIPSMGRITNSLTLQLVRQELILEMPCGYALTHTQVPQPITFRFYTSDNTIGSYRLRAFLQDTPLGDLRTETTGIGGTQAQFVASTGEVTAYYTPPNQPEVGATNFCVSVVDRPSMGDYCIPIVWGYETELKTRSRPLSTWHDGTWAVVWAESLQGDVFRANSGFISYDIPLSTASPDTAHLLFNKAAWNPNQCHILNDLITTGASNLSFEPMSYAGLLRFHITIPGADGQPITQDQLTLLGAERLTLRNFNAVMHITAESAESSTSFTFDASQPDIEYFYLLSTDIFDANQPETQVLVRLYAPSESLDLDANTLHLQEGDTNLALTTSIENYIAYGRQPNVMLTITNNPPPNGYIDPTPVLVNDEIWHAIYFFAWINSSDIKRYG